MTGASPRCTLGSNSPCELWTSPISAPSTMIIIWAASANCHDSRAGSESHRRIEMNFWDVHGLLFLLGLVAFPRITVFFFSHVIGGPIFWIFFLIFPRLVIPILAAYHYWGTNPILVILSF